MGMIWRKNCRLEKEMGMTEDRKRYLSEYKRTVLTRIPLDVKKEFRAEVQRRADMAKESLTAYVKKAIQMRMDLENAEQDMEEGVTIRRDEYGNEVRYKSFVIPKRESGQWFSEQEERDMISNSPGEMKYQTKMKRNG